MRESRDMADFKDFDIYIVFFELGLSGLAIRINGNIEAISVYEKMSPDTAVVHYEKGSPDYDGIYKEINAETANILHNDFKLINPYNER